MAPSPDGQAARRVGTIPVAYPHTRTGAVAEEPVCEQRKHGPVVAGAGKPPRLPDDQCPGGSQPSSTGRL